MIFSSNDRALSALLRALNLIWLNNKQGNQYFLEAFDELSAKSFSSR